MIKKVEQNSRTMTFEEEKLSRAVGSKRLCRCFFEGLKEPFPGYILSANETFLLMAREEDFTLNGFEVRLTQELRRIDFVDPAIDEILLKEGVSADQAEVFVDLTSFRSLFASLFLKNEMVFVESNDGEKNYYDYGKILRVNRESIHLLPFDENGLWMEDVEIFFDEILGVTFADRYVRLWRDYLETRRVRAKNNPVSYLSEMIRKWNPAGFSLDELTNLSYAAEAQEIAKLLKQEKSFDSFAEQFFSFFQNRYPTLKKECFVLETIWLETMEF